MLLLLEESTRHLFLPIDVWLRDGIISLGHPGFKISSISGVSTFRMETCNKSQWTALAQKRRDRMVTAREQMMYLAYLKGL